MGDIEFLSVSPVEALHAEQLHLHGGSAGFIDRTVVESAVAMPAQAMFGRFLHEDIAAMAAAYLFHLAAPQGFADGNKRTAVVAAVTFPALNGFRIEAEDLDMYDLTMDVANHRAGKDEAAAWFRDRLRPLT